MRNNILFSLSKCFVKLKHFRPQDEEDPYGRCTNMKLTSFTEQQLRQQQQQLMLQQQQQQQQAAAAAAAAAGSARDPRIIDLTQSTSTVSSTTSLCSTPRQVRKI